jgi:hypothetical protein
MNSSMFSSPLLAFSCQCDVFNNSNDTATETALEDLQRPRARTDKANATRRIRTAIATTGATLLTPMTSLSMLKMISANRQRRIAETSIGAPSPKLSSVRRLK